MSTRLPLALLACAVVAASAAPASAATKKPIDVSLAWSYTKTASGEVAKSASGYTELVAAKARKSTRYGSRLSVKRFACPGESTAGYLGTATSPASSLLNCGFKKSQHADSIASIKKNRMRLGFITLSIGANTFTPCSKGASEDHHGQGPAHPGRRGPELRLHVHVQARARRAGHP